MYDDFRVVNICLIPCVCWKSGDVYVDLCICMMLMLLLYCYCWIYDVV